MIPMKNLWPLILLAAFIGLLNILKSFIIAKKKEIKYKKNKKYYIEQYLKSEAWQRKRAIVLKRDKNKCVFCGAPATEVHHKKYAKNIGKEPIEWLTSVCNSCHKKNHVINYKVENKTPY